MVTPETCFILKIFLNFQFFCFRPWGSGDGVQGREIVLSLVFLNLQGGFHLLRKHHSSRKL